MVLTSRPRGLVIQATLDFFGYPVEAALKLYSGTLKLPHSSTPFAKRFSTWSVQCQSRLSLEVGTSTLFQVHIPDHDPGNTRPAERFRIFGKVSAGKRSGVVILGFPTGKGRSIQDLGNRGMWWMLPSPFFFAWCLLDFGCPTSTTCSRREGRGVLSAFQN